MRWLMCLVVSLMASVASAQSYVDWNWGGSPPPGRFYHDVNDDRGLVGFEASESFGSVVDVFVGPVLSATGEGTVYKALMVLDSGWVFDAAAIQFNDGSWQWDDWNMTGQWEIGGTISDGTFHILADEFVSFQVPEPAAASLLCLSLVGFRRSRP